MNRFTLALLGLLLPVAAWAADTVPYISGTAGLTSGHLVTSGATVGQLTDGGAVPTYSASVGWIATVNPTGALIFVAPAALTVTSIVGNVEVASGGTSTVSVFKAATGTACGSGTIQHSGSFNANGTAATNQTLTLVGGAGNVLASGNRICITTTGTTGWTAGTGIGGITVNYTIP